MRWILALLIGSSLLGTFAVLRWGLRPKPIPQINPSPIEDLRQAGILAYQRLRPMIREQEVVWLLSTFLVQNPEVVWDGLKAAAAHDGWKGEFKLVGEKSFEEDKGEIEELRLWLTLYVVEESQLERIQPPCSLDSGQPLLLSCASERISRKFFRRQHPPEQMRVAAERHGFRDYIIFVYQP